MIAFEHVGIRAMETVEAPDVEPGPGEVRVDVRVGGICGSDLHTYRGEPWPFTRILGHEPSGVIDRVGAGVDVGRIGERVSVYHYDGCGSCERCRRGETHWCADMHALGWHKPGSCGRQVVCNAGNALPIPDDMSFEAGAILACGAATTVYTSLSCGSEVGCCADAEEDCS
jgi:L-iditol 2-dehydrogenase